MGIEEASKQASKQKKHVAIIKECRSFKPLGHAHAHAAAPVELQPGGACSNGRACGRLICVKSRYVTTYVKSKLENEGALWSCLVVN